MYLENKELLLLSRKNVLTCQLLGTCKSLLLFNTYAKVRVHYQRSNHLHIAYYNKSIITNPITYTSPTTINSWSPIQSLQITYYNKSTITNHLHIAYYNKFIITNHLHIAYYNKFITTNYLYITYYSSSPPYTSPITQNSLSPITCT